jgi:hypothetical protein
VSYKAQTDWWDNAKSASWILIPFWIIKWGAKVLVTTQVQNGFICWILFINACVRAKRKKTVVDGAISIESILKFFFYRTFYLNSKFQLICIQIDLAMENLCLAAILIFFAILFFYAPIFLWFQLLKYITRFTLNSIASGMKIALPIKRRNRQI